MSTSAAKAARAASSFHGAMVAVRATSVAGLSPGGAKMWVARPSSAVASASIRPSCPPPKIPTTPPACSGAAAIARALGDGGGLRLAPARQACREAGIRQGKDRRGMEGGVDGAGLADGERRHGHAAGHLDDGIEAVEAAERLGLDRNTE